LLRHSAERQNALRHLEIKNDSVSCSILVLQIKMVPRMTCGIKTTKCSVKVKDHYRIHCGKRIILSGWHLVE
jgi:hypothetical protein